MVGVGADYELIESSLPGMIKVVVRVNIFRHHRQVHCLYRKEFLTLMINVVVVVLSLSMWSSDNLTNMVLTEAIVGWACRQFNTLRRSRQHNWHRQSWWWWTKQLLSPCHRYISTPD